MLSRMPSKQRLQELISMACAYRGWSFKDMAIKLGRDAHHLVPGSGVPKLDIVLALADALDWTVQEVVDDLCVDTTEASTNQAGPSGLEESFAKLNRAAWDALQAAEFERAWAISRRAYVVASTPNERAIACLRGMGACDSLGNYRCAMELVRCGLAESPIDESIEILLRSNLAHCHYMLAEHEEACGIATALLNELEPSESPGSDTRSSRGFARLVRGLATRARLVAGATPRPSRSRVAANDLAIASELLDEAGRDYPAPGYFGLALTARGALLTLRALIGDMSASAALEAVMSQLDGVAESPEKIDKHILEAIGWWCIFGCEVAMRSDLPEGERDRHVAILTNAAWEITGHGVSTHFRQRLFDIEYEVRRAASADTTTEREPWILDEEDVRSLLTCIAGNPSFRARGREILWTAERIEGEVTEEPAKPTRRPRRADRS